MTLTKCVFMTCLVLAENLFVQFVSKQNIPNVIKNITGVPQVKQSCIFYTTNTSRTPHNLGILDQHKLLRLRVENFKQT